MYPRSSGAAVRQRDRLIRSLTCEHDAINQILHLLAVPAREGQGEFSTLGLRRHRKTKSCTESLLQTDDDQATANSLLMETKWKCICQTEDSMITSSAKTK